jgi:hypothetical protein
VDNRIPEMDWPAQSPDLNPRQHPWDQLECQIRSRPQRLTSVTALATALQEEWAAISLEKFRHLVESLPGISVHDWEVCHREIHITVSSRCPDTFDQIVYFPPGMSDI